VTEGYIGERKVTRVAELEGCGILRYFLDMEKGLGRNLDAIV
jgi:hypothetical protein